jgi:hypothetical protein
MERLWSRAVATGRNGSQMEQCQERLKRAETVAMRCDRLPIGAHGKEGVDGSSPSEGLRKCLQIGTFCCLFHQHADTKRTHLRYPSLEAEVASDDHALDLVRALADLEDLLIAI